MQKKKKKKEKACNYFCTKLIIPQIYHMSVYVLYVCLCFIHKKRENFFPSLKNEFSPLRSAAVLRMYTLGLSQRWYLELNRCSVIISKCLFLNFHRGLVLFVCFCSRGQQVLANLLREWSTSHSCIESLFFFFRGSDHRGEGML